MSSSFVFPGYPAYLADAAGRLARPEAASGAGQLVALTALANLCAQASRTDPARVDAILLKAIEFRDQLAVALQAANAMLADVDAAHGGNGPSLDMPTDSSRPTPLSGRAASRRSVREATS